MSASLRSLAPRGGTALSAVLLVLAFPPFGLHALVWLAFVPWLHVIARAGSARAAILQAFWLSGLFASVTGYGVAPAMTEYLQRSMAFGVVTLVVHAFLCQLQLVLFAPLFRRWPMHGALGCLTAALLYTGLDHAAPKLLRDTVGLVLHGYPALSQVAELGGVRLLTFLVLVANLALHAILHERPARAWPAAATAAALLAASALFGNARIASWDQRIAAAPRTVQVGIVQGNVPRELRRRWAEGDVEAARESLAIYQRETDALLHHHDAPDLVLWPETAYPGTFRKPGTREQLALNIDFDRWVAARGVPLVFGAYDVEEREEGGRVLLNGLFFLEPRAAPDARTPSPMKIHHKSRLFPIGEYLPFVGRSRARQWLPGAGALSHAGAPGTHEIGVGEDRQPIRLGPAICYEDLFTAHTSALARLGAELFVNVSSDSWFGDSGVSRLHLAAAKLRSIETRLPQVRATNTGYSAVILPTGRLAAVSEFGETWALSAAVPITAAELTLAARLGDWFGPASLLAAAASALALRLAAARPGAGLPSSRAG